MFNVIINSEQYDEFMAQKEKIKELEARNESLYKNYQQELSDKANLINECDRLTNVVHKHGSDIINLRSKNRDLVTEAYRLKIANNDLKEQNEAIIKEHDELKNKVTRFGEIVSENYRLKQSIADLKANNKKLKTKIKDLCTTIINPCCDFKDALNVENNNLKERCHSKDIPEVKHDTMYLMSVKEVSKLYERINRIEARLDIYNDYIYGGKNDD